MTSFNLKKFKETTEADRSSVKIPAVVVGYYTVLKIAELEDVAPQTVRNWCATGKLKFEWGGRGKKPERVVKADDYEEFKSKKRRREIYLQPKTADPKVPVKTMQELVELVNRKPTSRIVRKLANTINLLWGNQKPL